MRESEQKSREEAFYYRFDKAPLITQHLRAIRELLQASRFQFLILVINKFLKQKPVWAWVVPVFHLAALEELLLESSIQEPVDFLHQQESFVRDL